MNYISQEPAVCLAVDFACGADQTSFDDDCGCGCLDADPRGSCPDPTDPSVHYVSQDVLTCLAVDFLCESGQSPFERLDDEACGCGCIDAT